MIKNILVTGAPSSGKTTVIKKVIKMLNYPMKGFYTEEEREGGKRTGFIMSTIDGKKGYLAHSNIQSLFRIRRYGVSLENVESIAVPSIKPEENYIIILDEIGKMECFSEIFRDAAINALNSPCIVIGSITLGGDQFIRKIKERNDIIMYEVNNENRDSLPAEIMNVIKNPLNSKD